MVIHTPQTGGPASAQQSGFQATGPDQCLCCGKTGHRKADCPMKDKSCDICGKLGHVKATCGHTGSGAYGQQPGPAQGFQAVGADNCLCCGKTGHRKADCPMKDKSCDICGGVGHLRNTCRSAGMGGYVQQFKPQFQQYSAPAQQSGFQATGADQCLCCGKTGHRKADCPMKDKSCDICGKTGHLRTTCGHAASGGGGMAMAMGNQYSAPAQQSGFQATGADQCLCCGKTGHRKADCPMKDKSCDICGKIGHLRTTCGHAASGGKGMGMSMGMGNQYSAPAQQSGFQATGADQCLCCGKTGHRKADCPMKDKSCDICGKTGHLRTTCGHAASGGGGMSGYVQQSGPAQGFQAVGADNCLCCGKTGHRKADCPMKDKQCDICGGIGHLRSTCRQSGGAGGAYGNQQFAYGNQQFTAAPVWPRQQFGGAFGGGQQFGGQQFGGQQSDPSQICGCCGHTGHGKWACPMQGKACDLCGMVGHIKATCRQAEGNATKGKGKGSRYQPF